MEMTRRVFLLSVSVLGIFSWLTCAHWPPRYQVSGGQAMPFGELKRSLLELFTDQNSSRLLGKRYLDLYPHHRARAILLGKRIQSLQPQTSTDLKRMLSRQRESDFQNGETVLVDGWLLARTEVEACALTVIL